MTSSSRHQLTQTTDSEHVPDSKHQSINIPQRQTTRLNCNCVRRRKNNRIPLQKKYYIYFNILLIFSCKFFCIVLFFNNYVNFLEDIAIRLVFWVTSRASESCFGLPSAAWWRESELRRCDRHVLWRSTDSEVSIVRLVFPN